MLACKRVRAHVVSFCDEEAENSERLVAHPSLERMKLSNALIYCDTSKARGET